MQKNRTLFPRGMEKQNIENLDNEKHSKLSHRSDLGQHKNVILYVVWFALLNVPYTMSSFLHELIALDTKPLQE